MLRPMAFICKVHLSYCSRGYLRGWCKHRANIHAEVSLFCRDTSTRLSIYSASGLTLRCMVFGKSQVMCVGSPIQGHVIRCRQNLKCIYVCSIRLRRHELMARCRSPLRVQQSSEEDDHTWLWKSHETVSDLLPVCIIICIIYHIKWEAVQRSDVFTGAASDWW